MSGDGKGRPAFSVGLLTHNYGRYLRGALDSVLAQTFRDFECVVCDDASTDDTPEIVRSYLGDPRVRYVRHERNLRQGGNWGHFLANARADRIATLHADDAWEPDALARAAAAFDADPSLDVVTGGWQTIDLDGRPVGGPTHAGDIGTQPGGREAYLADLRRFTRLPSATFFTRHALDGAGLPRTDLDMLVDAELFLRIVAAARRVGRLPDVVARYRVHQTSMTATTARDGRFVNELRRLPEIAAEHAIADAATLAVVNEQVAREIYSTALAAFVGPQPEAGRSMIEEAGRRWRPLTREPVYAIDRVLARLGGFGLSVARVLHRDRVPKARQA